MSTIVPPHNIQYPESDGRPFDSDLHREEIMDLIGALKRRYQDVSDVYVSGNLFIYYVQGDPQEVVAPDVFLVRGVPKGPRRIYKLWEEGRVPSLVIEVTSDRTQDEDLTTKKELYERLGVEEYFLHDPYQNYLEPALQGFRLVKGRYQPLLPGSDGSLRSRTTGLDLHVEGEKLRLVDAATGEPLLWDEELRYAFLQSKGAARELAEDRANREAAARQALEEELNRLRREIEGKRRSE